jgi:hypothetical protein
MQRNDIDARTLKDMLERDERVTVVDVRKRGQHAEGAIPGSVNFDAYDALKAGDDRAMEGLKPPECPWSPSATTGTQARRPPSSCAGEGTRRSPWRAGWKPGRTSKACP